MQYEKHLKNKNTDVQMKYFRYILKYIYTLKYMLYKIVNKILSEIQSKLQDRLNFGRECKREFSIISFDSESFALFSRRKLRDSRKHNDATL